MKALSTLGLSVILIAGCGGVRKSVVASQNVTVPQVRVFPAEEMSNGRFRFRSVKLFLWKEPMSGDVIANVNVCAGKLAHQDDLGAQVTLDEEPLDVWKVEKDELRREAKTIEAKIKKQQQVVDDAKKAADAAPGDTDLQDKFKREQDNLDTLKNSVAARQKVVAERIAELLKMIGTKQVEIDDRRAAVESDSNLLVEELMGLVDWYEGQPSEIYVDLLAEGGPLVTVENWDPKDGMGARTFTSQVRLPDAPDDKTAWGAITQVKYSATNSHFSFTLGANNGYSFDFDFWRSNYDDKYGRMLMSGDLTRTRPHEATRYGVVKLSDRKN